MTEKQVLKVGHVSGYCQRGKRRLCTEIHPGVLDVVWTQNVLVVVLTSPEADDYPRPGKDPYLIVDVPLCQPCADRLGLGQTPRLGGQRGGGRVCSDVASDTASGTGAAGTAAATAR